MNNLAPLTDLVFSGVILTPAHGWSQRLS